MIEFLKTLQVLPPGRASGGFRVHLDAVGTIITDRPPHRSVRALLRIRLPPWMCGEESHCRIRMQNAWGCKPPREDR